MTEKIPFHRPFPLPESDLRTIQKNTRSIIKSGILSKNGKWCQQLEQEIQEYYGCKYVIATSSCTMGLMIAISYLYEQTWDLCFQVPAFEWWSVADVFKMVRGNLFWNDIEFHTLFPNEKFECASLYLNPFGSMGRSKIENAIYDSSHCLGGKIHPNYMGLCHVFSLAPTKLVTSCEGGIIITNDDEFYKYAKEKRDRMARMSEVHAMIGIEYLKYLGIILYWKKTVYEYYKKHILGTFQEIPYDSTYNTIYFLNDEELIIPEEIETRQYYEPIKPQVFGQKLYITDVIYRDIVCLPSYYNCPYKEIVEKIKERNNL